MQIPRLFYSGPLKKNILVTLSKTASQHVLHVLRLKPKAKLILFNGEGGEFSAELESAQKNIANAKIINFHERDIESCLKIHLGQGISRGERMDYTIQKAVELGVNIITPLFTERCGVKLSGERLQKRITHWQNIAISACEQCGRNIIPRIATPKRLGEWVNSCNGLSFVCDPTASEKLIGDEGITKVNILIGPEGGLIDDEIALAKQENFQSLSLGPRILRTETAAVVAISLLQRQWGDL